MSHPVSHAKFFESETTAATMSVFAEYVGRYAQALRRTDLFCHQRPATMVPRAQVSIQFGIARIYEALNENPQIQIRIVRTVTEAAEWFADPNGGTA